MRIAGTYRSRQPNQLSENRAKTKSKKLDAENSNTDILNQSPRDRLCRGIGIDGDCYEHLPL
jgi:hypothetical protein